MNPDGIILDDYFLSALRTRSLANPGFANGLC